MILWCYYIFRETTSFTEPHRRYPSGGKKFSVRTEEPNPYKSGRLEQKCRGEKKKKYLGKLAIKYKTEEFKLQLKMDPQNLAG